MSSKETLKYALPLGFAIATVVGMLIGMQVALVNPSKDAVTSAGGAVSGREEKIKELLRYIDARYVDEVDENKLLDRAIEEVLEELDPHTAYIGKKDAEILDEQMAGEFVGIGIEYLILDDTVTVITPVEGGPSAKAGLKRGDRIIAVNGKKIASTSLSSDSTYSLLRGEKGSKVQLDVWRRSTDTLLKVTIKRDVISSPSVQGVIQVANNVPYLRIESFNKTTYEEFAKALVAAGADKKPLEKLIIDLRQNPGGYLQQATQILEQLIREKDKLLVYTEGRGTQRSDYETQGRAMFEVKDLVVLIDEGSASASEIIAGAIQDNDRGILVGRRSYGKGLVQEQYTLRDGSALRLTVARYYTPSGRSIQRPFQSGDFSDYEAEYKKRFEQGELQDAAKIQKKGPAYFTRKGREVYAQGGITPDVFIPIDSATLRGDARRVMPFFPSFAFRIWESKKYAAATPEQILENLKGNTAWLEALSKYSTVKKQPVSLAILQTNHSYLLDQLYYQLVRYTFDDDKALAAELRTDKMVIRAGEILNSKEPMALLEQRKNNNKTEQ